MITTTYYLGQSANPIAFLNKYAKMNPLRKHRLYRDVRNHQRYNAGMPYIANLGAGRILIVETPIQIELFSCWLAGRTW